MAWTEAAFDPALWASAPATLLQDLRSEHDAREGGAVDGGRSENDNDALQLLEAKPVELGPEARAPNAGDDIRCGVRVLGRKKRFIEPDQQGPVDLPHPVGVIRQCVIEPRGQCRMVFGDKVDSLQPVNSDDPGGAMGLEEAAHQRRIRIGGPVGKELGAEIVDVRAHLRTLPQDVTASVRRFWTTAMGSTGDVAAADGSKQSAPSDSTCGQVRCGGRSTNARRGGSKG